VKDIILEEQIECLKQENIKLRKKIENLKKQMHTAYENGSWDGYMSSSIEDGHEKAKGWTYLLKED